MYTVRDVLNYIEEDDVKFVRLAFCDGNGRKKSVTVLPGELPGIFEQGLLIDAEQVEGYGERRLLLLPDSDTMAVVPWHPVHGKMIRMYCDLYRVEGSRLGSDGRYILSRAQKAAEEKGIRLRFASAMDFTLFKTDGDGTPLDKAFDNAGYMDIDHGDRCEGIRREIIASLQDMDVEPVSTYHGADPGQNRIELAYEDPLRAADNAITLPSVTRTVASRNGLYASFYPMPRESGLGNGMEIRMQAEGIDLKTARDRIAAHLPELCSLLYPTEDSYRRLAKIREKKTLSLQHIGTDQGLRLLTADPNLNPYRVFALLIYAMLDEAADGSGNRAERAEQLPQTLEEAAALTGKSGWIAGCEGFEPEGNPFA